MEIKQNSEYTFLNLSLYFRSCFPILSPTAYRSACNQMVSTKLKHDRVDKACLVAKTYVSMARENFATDCIIPDLCSKYFREIKSYLKIQ